MQADYLNEPFYELNESDEAIIVKPIREKRHWATRYSVVFISCVLAGMPLFFGGKSDVAITAFKQGVFVLGAVISIYFLFKGEGEVFLVSLGRVGKKAFLFSAAFVSLVLFQIAPLPQGIVSFLSKAGHEMYRSAEVLGFYRISVEVYTSIAQLSWAGAVLIFGLWIVALPREDINTSISHHHHRRSKNVKSERYERARKIDYVVDVLQRAIIFSGFSCSLIAIVHLVMDEADLFGMFERPNVGVGGNRAHWPFPNPNHLAVLLEVAVITAFSRLLRTSYLSRMKLKFSRDRQLLMTFIRNPDKLRYHIGQFFVIFVMMLAAVLSLSRMGISLLMLGLLVVWKSYEGHRQNGGGACELDRDTAVSYVQVLFEKFWKRAKTPLLIFFVGGVILFFIGQGGRELLTKRIEYGLAADRDFLRYELAKGSLSVFASFPILGVGLGCWHLAVLRYLPVELAGWTMDYAHNDYLQVFAETGAIGAIIVCGFLLVVFRHSKRALAESRLVVDRIQLLGSTVAVLLPLLHSLVDYPMHIPATAITIVAALAIHMRLINRVMEGPKPQSE